MESKTQIPSFTISLRGYDREEVDEYLDSLADALGHVDDTHEQNRRLQAHITRLNSRIKDLEDRINADTPRTGAVLGERIGILLRSAEDTATDTINRAEARAAEMVAEAEAKVLEAEESARAAIARGDEQARRIEAAARGEAAEIISEAEARATARTRQIEQWAEQVVSHTRAEEARMLREHQEKRNAANAELRALADQRDAAAATLAELRESLGQALGLVSTSPAASLPEPQVSDLEVGDIDAGAPASVPAPPVHDEAVAESEEVAAEEPAQVVDAGPSLYDDQADEGVGEDRTGEIEALAEPAPAATITGELDDQSAIDPDDFERKLEAWVTETGTDRDAGGARHFRRD